MVNAAIHRIIEHRAAIRPDAVALVDGVEPLSYRELNQRANALARRLGESGLARGSLALVRLDRSLDLAVVLLAVLKAGASYAWVEQGTPGADQLPADFCIVRLARGAVNGYLTVDIARALADRAPRPSPNLPILTRATDVACVLPDLDGTPHVLVPHGTVTSLPPMTDLRDVTWGAGGASLDLWRGLMSGATITVDAPVHTHAGIAIDLPMHLAIREPAGAGAAA